MDKADYHMEHCNCHFDYTHEKIMFCPLHINAFELLAALKPFAWLAKVMQPGEMLNHRGVYVSYEDAQEAAAATAAATERQPA